VGARLGWIGVGLTLLAAAALLGAGEVAWSASATPWLEALGKADGGPAFGAMGRAARDLGDAVGLAPEQAIRVMAIVLVLSQLALLLTLGRRCLGPAMGWLPAALALLWPVSRQAMQVISAEMLLATAGLLVAASATEMLRRPRMAALGAALGLLLAVIGHPVGLPLAAGLIVILALWPRPRGGAEVPRQGFPSHPLWLAWLSALALFGGLLLLARPDDGLKHLWMSAMASYRPGVHISVAGGLADLPMVGPCFALLARMSPAVALLGLASVVRALGHGRSGPVAPAAAVLAWWGILVVLFRHPTPGALDPLVAMAPLVALLAAAGVGRWLRSLWGNGHPAGRPVAALLAFALALSLISDGVRLLPADPRTGLAHALSMLDDPAADIPAVLTADAIELMGDQPGVTSVLPAHRGGDSLASALNSAHVLRTHAHYPRLFGADMLLLQQPPADPIGVFWASRLEEHACSRTGDFCLLRITARDKP
jgi:hypothetical protein